MRQIHPLLDEFKEYISRDKMVTREDFEEEANPKEEEVQRRTLRDDEISNMEKAKECS